MKKLRNEKGFAMAELLAVCIIVLGIFAVLFSNYLPLTAEYENRVTYNNVNAEYAATYIRKAFKDVKVYDALKNLYTTGYYTLYTCESGGGCEIKDGIFTKSDGTSRNSEYEKKKNQIIKFINEYGIQEIIITKYKTKEVKDKYKSGLLYNYIKYIPTFKDSKITKTGKYRIILKTKDYGYATVPLRYAEPNEPELKDDLVPVYYDNGLWMVADSTNESITHGWYDYVEKHWANAVKLTGSCSKTVGSNVTSCIKSMWVWIPRYKYEKFSSKKPTQINVTFLASENTKDTPHPVFGSKDSKTTGFWVGKYEGSSDNKIIKGGTGKASNAIGSGDITNQEWGAVAYLAYSKYGTCSENADGDVSCNGVSPNNDDEFITGAGGVNSSTTNNNYGVFDMNGGRFEIVNGASEKGKGTGSSVEILSNGHRDYTYDHWFKNENNCASAKCRPYTCCYSYSCQKTDSEGNSYTGTCTSCHTCYETVCLGSADQRTDNVYTQSCRGGVVVNNPMGVNYTAKGSSYYSWKNKTMYKDSCLGDNSEYLDLRGASAKGNAACIKTKKTISIPDTKNRFLNVDSGNNHYILESDYNGIFSYSSSKYVDSNYITHRSVIR